MKTAADRTFGTGEIRAFTGLRGCAAVLVMLYHFSLNMPAGSGPLRTFLTNGYLWVDLFFVLSGFVMAYSQADAFRGGYRLRSHATFLIHRLARIYPLYLLVLIESASLALWRLEHADFAFWRTVLCNLTLVQAWGLAPSLEGAAWSISTEWGAYLLFPLLLAATVLPGRRTAWLAGGLAMLTILYLAIAPGPFTFAEQGSSGPLDIYSSATAAPLVRCVAEFTLGLLAFRVARHLSAGRPVWTGPASLATFVVLLLALSRPGLDVGVVALFFVLLAVLAPQAGMLATGLGMKLPYRLGQWSYSIYLIHDKFSHPAAVLEKQLAGHVPFAPVVATAIMAGAVIACGGLTFVLVERPLRKFFLGGVSRIAMLRSEPTEPADVAPGPAAGNVNALG